MSGTRCQLLWASVMSHVQGTVRPQSPGQRQPTAPMQWSQATAQISTSSRMRPARPPISRGSLLKPPDWLSQTIASSVDTQQHQVYCTILHHNCKFLLRETISSLDLKLDRDLYFKDAKGLLFKDGLDGPLDGSQNKTAIFLKTLNVNTMMTNTAGKIILAMTIFTVGMGVILTLLVPDRTICESRTELCEYLKMTHFYRTTIPSTIVLVIIFLVLGFTVFRSHHIGKKRGIDHPENVGDQGAIVQGTEHEIEVRSGDSSQGELFTVQRAISELNGELEENHETHAGNVEDDIVVEDIELVTIKTPQLSSDQVSIGVMIGEISQTGWNDQTKCQCLPGVGVVIQTLNKYFKNTLMSLLILSSELPLYLTAMYGFITNSGCENPTFMLMSEISYYSIFMFDIFWPFLLKLKLDRLSQ